jgi:hypothetical protein
MWRQIWELIIDNYIGNKLWLPYDVYMSSRHRYVPMTVGYQFNQDIIVEWTIPMEHDKK